jgi:hypothetical protein
MGVGPLRRLLIISRILDGGLSDLVSELALTDETRVYLVGDGVYNIRRGGLRPFLASDDDLRRRGVKAEGLKDEGFYDRLIEDLMEWCDSAIFI